VLPHRLHDAARRERVSTGGDQHRVDDQVRAGARAAASCCRLQPLCQRLYNLRGQAPNTCCTGMSFLVCSWK
jgi:hypothetical protein